MIFCQSHCIFYLNSHRILAHSCHPCADVSNCLIPFGMTLQECPFLSQVPANFEDELNQLGCIAQAYHNFRPEHFPVHCCMCSKGFLRRLYTNMNLGLELPHNSESVYLPHSHCYYLPPCPRSMFRYCFWTPVPLFNSLVPRSDWSGGAVCMLLMVGAGAGGG